MQFNNSQSESSNFKWCRDRLQNTKLHRIDHIDRRCIQKMISLPIYDTTDTLFMCYRIIIYFNLFISFNLNSIKFILLHGYTFEEEKIHVMLSHKTFE